MFLHAWRKCVQNPFAPDDFQDLQLQPLREVEMRTTPRPEDYEPVSTLGIGGVGTVFLAKWKEKGMAGGELLAVKTMDKRKLAEAGQQMHAMEELRVMRRLAEQSRARPCPYILPLRAAFHSSSTLYLVMPFIQGGDLHNTIQRQADKKLPEPAVQLIAAEITLALDALHSMDIVFRDLKPMNVLITTDGHVQLTDFGLAKQGVSRSTTQTTCGTPLYMSPEQVQHATMMGDAAGDGYSFAVDWWALGTLIYESLTGKPPFVARQIGNIMHKIANTEHSFPGDHTLTPEAVAITAQLLEKDADRRLGAEGTADVQRHPWFAVVDWEALQRREVPAVYIPPAVAAAAATAVLDCFDPEVTAEKVDAALFQPETLPPHATGGGEPASPGPAGSPGAAGQGSVGRWLAQSGSSPAGGSPMADAGPDLWEEYVYLAPADGS